VHAAREVHLLRCWQPAGAASALPAFGLRGGLWQCHSHRQGAFSCSTQLQLASIAALLGFCSSQRLLCRVANTACPHLRSGARDLSFSLFSRGPPFSSFQLQPLDTAEVSHQGFHPVVCCSPGVLKGPDPLQVVGPPPTHLFWCCHHTVVLMLSSLHSRVSI
jgi:hypothetical protein